MRCKDAIAIKYIKGGNGNETKHLDVPHALTDSAPKTKTRKSINLYI